jgi:cytochrome P450
MDPALHPESSAAYPFNAPIGLRLSAEYEHVRARAGLARVQLAYGEPAWLVTRHVDARSVLSDRRFGRSESTLHDEPRATKGRAGRGLIAMDPPQHTWVRAAVARAFTVRQVESMRPWVRSLVAVYLDRMHASGRSADLVSQLAIPLPLAVLRRLLGAPEADFPQLRAWSEALLMSNSLPTEEFEANFEAFRAYVRELIRSHREDPRDDLITLLIDGGRDKTPLSDHEMEQLCLCLQLAGSVSPSSQIANFAYTLLQHPDQFALLREDPDLVPNAVEELLRFVQLRIGSLHPRYARADVEVGGTLVRAGEAVLVDLGAANHDPAQFENPDVLDVTRQGIKHVAFGHGFHHCVGAPLGRVELQEVLTALITRCPELAIAGEVTWKMEASLWGPRTLPVGW